MKLMYYTETFVNRLYEVIRSKKNFASISKDLLLTTALLFGFMKFPEIHTFPLIYFIKNLQLALF